MTRPRTWLFSDSTYAGGAERYLELLLHGAGPDRLGVVGVGHPGLLPWLHARRSEGFALHVLSPGSSSDLWRAWWRWVRAERPRVVHVNMPGPYDGLMATAPWIARRAGAQRVIVTEHLPGVGRVGKRYHWKRAFRGGIDRAIVVCEAHRETMRREFGYDETRVVAIHNGIADPATRRPRADERALLPGDLRALEKHEGLRIVQVGSVEARKGPGRLVRAFAAARGAGLRATLWFVGDGPERVATERLAGELGCGDHVVFTGHRADVADLLRAADVVALASEREGLPYSLIEACAWARPLVALDVDGVGEIVLDGRTGVLVAPHREDALPRALLEVASDRERRLRWGDAARAHYEASFRLERTLERTFAEYGPEAFA